MDAALDAANLISLFRFVTDEAGGLDEDSPRNQSGDRLAVIHPSYLIRAEELILELEESLRVAKKTDATVHGCTETQVPHIISTSSTSLTERPSTSGESIAAGGPGSEGEPSVGTTGDSEEPSGQPERSGA